MHIIRRDLPLCPFLLHCWNSLLTLRSFFFQIPDLWNGARKTWPLIPTRRNHKRRINRNESAGQCDGFLWTLDILTGSIISSDSRFLSSSSFFLLFSSSSLLLFFFFLHLKRNRSYCDEGVTPFERGLARRDPSGSDSSVSKTKNKFMDLGSTFYVEHRYTLLSLVLAPSRASLIRPLKKYIFFEPSWSLYQRSTISPANHL